MIFRTITDEVTGATKSIGLFGKSLSELKDIFSSINTNGLFKTSVVSKTDLDCITKYNLLIENGIPYLEAMEQATIGASDATKQMIKNANGNTIALDNLTLGAKAASVAMGLLSAAANALVMYGISKLITAWNDYKDKIHEVANENAEQAEKSAEYLDSLLDLQNQLQDGTKSSDELTAAFKEQLKAMGYTEDKIDDLIVKYGGLAGAINEATKEALENAKTDAYTDLASASKSLEVDSVGGLTKDIQITDFGTGVEELDKQINEILSKVASKTADNGGSWTAKNNSAKGLYEYYKALQEVSRLIQETASETENKDLLNLGNFFVTTTYGEVTEAIDKLKESAEQYGDAINRLHNADAQLELANYLKTNSIDSKEAFDSYVEGIQKSENYSEEYKQVLLQVANDAFPQFSSAAKDAKNSLDGFGNKTAVLSFEEQITQIHNLSEGLDQLDEIMADVMNGESFDYSSIIGNDDFKNAFGKYKTEYENFIQTITNSPDDISKCKSAFNDLATVYIYGSGALSNLTEESKNAAILELSQMGIANATEIVNDVFDKYSQALNAAKKYSIDLENQTMLTTSELANERDMAVEDAEALYNYAMQKELCSENPIDTVADCEALLNLAKQANATSETISLLSRLKNSMSVLNSEGAVTWGGKTKELAQKEVDSIMAELQSAKFTTNFSTDVKFDGGSKTKKEKNGSSSKSQKDTTKTLDLIEIRVEKLNDALSLLEANLENVQGAFAKNKLIDASIGLNSEKINNYTSALAVYTQKANEALSGIPADVAEQLKNGAIGIVDYIDDSNGSISEAISNYQKWNDKISNCQLEISNLREELEKLEKTKFENIASDFENMFNIHENSRNLADSYIEYFEKTGQLVGESLYRSQLQSTEKQLEILNQEKAKLVEQMNSAVNSGRVEIGSETYLSMISTLSDLDEKIIDCKTSVEEFEDAINNIDDVVFERIQKRFDDIESELENLTSLFDDIEVSDGNGGWSNKALANLGLLAQQLELNKYQIASYEEQIKKLNYDYLAGKYSIIEYQDKLAELKEEQFSAVSAMESIKNSIVELNKTRVEEEINSINEQVDAYEELIDAQIKALDSEKD